MEQIIVATADNIGKLATEIVRQLLENGTMQAKPQPEQTQEFSGETSTGYVYGLRGISNLFNVSLPTAQQYKNTFLQPAVIQRGRKLLIDKAKAIELFAQRQQQQ
jgi:hypothetical protein